jgi:DNA-directed RNA polymerase specialized sigma24 family protein
MVRALCRPIVIKTGARAYLNRVGRNAAIQEFRRRQTQPQMLYAGTGSFGTWGHVVPPDYDAREDIRTLQRVDPEGFGFLAAYAEAVGQGIRPSSRVRAHRTRRRFREVLNDTS